MIIKRFRPCQGFHFTANHPTRQFLEFEGEEDWSSLVTEAILRRF